MQNLVITGKGQELTAQLIAGISTATFTKIATSSYDYSSSTLEDVTELYDIKQTALVSKVSKTGTTIVEVLAKVDNTNLESGYYIKALGLYAKGSDGIEILFGVSIETDHPDYMPPQNGTAVSGISYRLNTKVDNSSQVTIEVNPAASPTMEQVETLERVINSHSKMDVCSSEGVHGFRYYNDALQVKNEKGVWINTETGENLDKSAIIDDLDTALAVTEDKVPVGCKAMQELNSNLKDGLKMTEDERKMLEYIYKANGGSNIETDMKVVKYIGQGTSFDIKTLYPASYQNFTADNFFCEPISSNSGYTSPDTHGYQGSSFYANYSFNKTYNANTGVLSVTSIVNFNINFAQYGYPRSNQQNVKAYIVL